tara:strand:+ start:5575 stop:6024 length:450 start_codon:yes stop_codon:yes gene_type:complete
MRIVAAFLCLILGASCSSSSSDDQSVVAGLEAKVEELSASLTASTESEAALEAKVEALQLKLEAASEQMKSGEYIAAWPDDYQETWIEICTLIVKGGAEADPSAAPAQDICACSLNGLMKAFKIREYESWTQELKDAAAAPYVSLCWYL